MEKIIKKAIEGGWRKGEPWFQGVLEQNNMFILDPLFWQALGKACGWGGSAIWACSTDCDYKCLDCGFELKNQISRPEEFSKSGEMHINCPEGTKWKDHALKFHEINLTESWGKACDFLYQLVCGE